MNVDVCIVGGGASGIFCAVNILMKNPHLSVTVLEKNARILKKLLSTGNGKCNYTNTDITEKSYMSDDVDLVMDILNRFPSDKIIDFFKKIGIYPAYIGSLVYPKNMQASSVCDALRMKAESLGVKIESDFEVVSAKRTNGGFSVMSADKRSVFGKTLVIASGSDAFIGSNSGIKLLRSFGHSAKKSFAALVPITSDDKDIKIAKGMRCSADVRLIKNGSEEFRERGEVLFTDFGLSGIVIMQLSAKVSKSIAYGKKEEFSVVLDMMPDMEESEISEVLREKIENTPYLTCENLFLGFLNKKIGELVLKKCGVSKSLPITKLSNSDISGISRKIKEFFVPVSDVCPRKNAQILGGGIPLCEFDENLESKIENNLYACGEVLDAAGNCGGFNLSWAWASAKAVSDGIFKKL